MMNRIPGRMWQGMVVLVMMALGSMAQAAEQYWDIEIQNFFRDQTMPLFIYARERDGTWVTAMGSSRDPKRQGGKTYNRSWYYGDLSATPIKDGAMKGVLKMHMTPDNWVPSNHRSYAIEIEVDAKVTGDAMEGTYTVKGMNTDDGSVAKFPKSGKLVGKAKAKAQEPLPNPATFVCHLQGALVGGDPKYGDRCLVLWVGVENGKLVSTLYGSMSQKFETFGDTPFTFEGNAVTADLDGMKGTLTVPTKTLDMDPCRYIVELDGHIFDGLFVGTYVLTAKIEGKPDVVINGSFDGSVQKGARKMAVDDRPWYAPVKGFQAVAAEEHPRLLFRKGDVEALRKKMATPEGQAILKRLRYLLDGKDGETMTTVFSRATKAYSDEGENPEVKMPGVYTFSHVVGYGLLYQLTGDKKYADFGRECFEKAIEGARDRDDRYSFKNSGGALRSGPVLGWSAVGYDLCYNGWDKATREKIGRALWEFKQGEEGGKQFDVEALTRGTMPPGSNHFGMQIGGMSLLLMALTGEPWVDQARVDKLLKVAEESCIRNLTEGFGDGGFFSEGDGTGSMASHIVYLTALQGWKTAMGKDYINVERPHARMTALKWLYGTVIRDGKPDFWPIRGAYGHNVWSRGGVSGGGYFALPMGVLNDDHRAAMKGYYETAMLKADSAAGKPYDTWSPYPHVSVCAFVNWPTDLKGRNPAEVLPLCYRDSTCGFYLWRNRWQDGQDTVVSVLSNRTQGYMGAKSDKALSINSLGKHGTWGAVSEGDTKHWWTSAKGEVSSLTLANGTCIAVDFTGASGADVMLVTTAKADGQAVEMAGKTLTFYFPTVTEAPKAEAGKDAVTVGKQSVSLKDGNLVLAVTAK